MKKKIYFLTMIISTVVLAGFVFSGCDTSASDDGSPVSVKVGEHMKFGTYQGEEIEWRVIDVDAQNRKALLLSEYGLDAKPYNEEYAVNISWEDSSLRQWLNGEFYEDVFTEEEAEKILLSTSEGFPEYNSRVPGYDYDKLERETEDYVFLLSYTEVYQYLGNTHGDESDPDRLCYPTEYAKNNETIYLSGEGACGWWLCAGVHGYNDRHVLGVVSAWGALGSENSADSGKYAVRPAVWIKL